jgi:hypothetical protein
MPALNKAISRDNKTAKRQKNKKDSRDYYYAKLEQKNKTKRIKRNRQQKEELEGE